MREDVVFIVSAGGLALKKPSPKQIFKSNIFQSNNLKSNTFQSNIFKSKIFKSKIYEGHIFKSKMCSLQIFKEMMELSTIGTDTTQHLCCLDDVLRC